MFHFRHLVWLYGLFQQLMFSSRLSRLNLDNNIWSAYVSFCPRCHKSLRHLEKSWLQCEILEIVIDDIDGWLCYWCQPSTDVMVGIMSLMCCGQKPYNVTNWHKNTPINNKSMYPWLYYTMWDKLLQLNTEEHNLTQLRNDKTTFANLHISINEKLKHSLWTWNYEVCCNPTSNLVRIRYT